MQSAISSISVLTFAPVVQADPPSPAPDPILAPLADVAVGARATGESSAGLPKLQSVVLGNGPALAVLNGKSYRVGQQVDGYTLVAINADAVVLEKAGKRHAVTLFASKIRV